MSNAQPQNFSNTLSRWKRPHLGKTLTFYSSPSLVEEPLKTPYHPTTMYPSGYSSDWQILWHHFKRNQPSWTLTALGWMSFTSSSSITIQLSRTASRESRPLGSLSKSLPPLTPKTSSSNMSGSLPTMVSPCCVCS